ncbi:MAG: c-type cytochrome [Beijerinckiaceae bacterium]|nr:c-type cytochrome [Beijerinckiaceae bacterium]
MSWLRRAVSLQSILLLLVLFGVAAAAFIGAGGIDVAADEADGWVTSHLLHFVFKRSVAARSGSLVPPEDLTSPSRVRLAAQHFDMVCANCHGRPGYGQSVVALSMDPRPQYLPNVLGQFTDPELYLILEHGVKYSAMPSWPTNARGDEVWSMVAFLRQLPALSAEVYREMTALPKIETPFANPAPDGALRPANPQRNSEPVDEFLYAAPASGFADQSIATSPAATCARCHGADGSGAVTGGEAPNLTIADAAHLKAALEVYTSGARKSGYMQPIAAELTGAQITALADYFASLPVKTVPSPDTDPALLKRGEEIATEGIRERAVPACANCHESAGAKLSNAPNIAGQSEVFLKRQLAAFGHGGRGSALGWNPMTAIAHDLSDDDAKALAAYYAARMPAKAGGGDMVVKPVEAHARLDPAAAKEIFETRCAKCHVNFGRGDAEGSYPNLTIQASSYVAQTLYSFRTRRRTNEKMLQVVDGLTLDELTNIASYVGGLPPEPSLGKPDEAAAARGAVLAEHGAPERGVPACLSCHGAAGVGALPLAARLQGQSAIYLRNRLDTFAQAPGRDGESLNPMPLIASRLTETERAELAAYFASLKPLQKSAMQP